jgi:Phage-related minor tail protein
VIFPAHTGSVQEFTAPKEGSYKLEVWGAQGNSSFGGTGGLGGYSYGNIILPQWTNLYIYVGQYNSIINDNPGIGTYNGGGVGSGSGGGATHMALSKRGELKNYLSYQSEVLIVAGGGGGGDGAIGGAGGGFTGETGGFVTNVIQLAAGGTQKGGGLYGYYYISGTGTSGSFGQGGEGGPGTDGNHGGAGGGGWYGGGGINFGGGGGGGSGYIGIGVSGTTIAGNQSFPSPNGGTEIGHSGNGYSVISWIP